MWGQELEDQFLCFPPLPARTWAGLDGIPLSVEQGRPARSGRPPCLVLPWEPDEE